MRELAGFFHHARDLLAVLDRSGRILQHSPSTNRVLGYPAGALDGSRLWDLIHPDDFRAVRAHLHELRVTGSATRLDCRVLRADGVWVAMRWSISAHARAARFYAVGRDRTRDLREREEDRSQGDAEMRLRTAGELHDGILQTMTAAGLQLEAAQRLVSIDAGAAQSVLKKLSELLLAEQREIRLFVDEARLAQPPPAGRKPLIDRLGAMLERVGASWEIGTLADVRLDEDLGPALQRDVLRLVQEAVVNAARHGKATTARIRATSQHDAVEIRVSDDGSGFPFRGNLSDAELRERRLGPVSLKQRVERAGGRIAIRSTSSGATVRITLPRPVPV